MRVKVFRPFELVILSAIGACSVLAPLCFGQSTLVGEMLEEVQRVEHDPVIVHRKNGSEFSGQFAGHVVDGFIMKQQVGIDGSVEVEIRWDEVESVWFAGGEVLGEIPDLFELGDYQSVVDVISPLFERQAPFFRLLPDEMLKPFQFLAISYLKLGLATESLGVVRSLKPWLQAENERQEIEDTELLDYLMLQLDEEAVALARIKIESAKDPSTVSLCWVALSLHHLNAGRYRQAWLCSVHPMLFDRQPDSPDLADAYLLAMISTLRLNRPLLAQRYHDAFLERDFALESKPYQKQWVQFFESIDWSELTENGDAIEQFADIESRIVPSEQIDRISVPIPLIPLTDL